MMGLAAQSIQKSAGVAQENLGRQTNAVPGEPPRRARTRKRRHDRAVRQPAPGKAGHRPARALARGAIHDGGKDAAHHGCQDAIDWVKVNVLEVGPDGQVRVMNDITASIADFVVSEQDYAGTLRQVMFDSINGMAQKVTPDVACGC